MSKKLEPFDIWEERACGCFRSTHRWWIVHVKCQLHNHVIPEETRAWMRSRAVGTEYGPVYLEDCDD